MSLRASCVINSNVGASSDSCIVYNCKKRRVSKNSVISSSVLIREIEASLPILQSPDYYSKPSLKELVTQELLDPGYCSCVPDFTVGKFGYESVRFLEKTDVRGLDLDQIVKFHRHEIVVYNDENDKPAVGQGLNKAAEVVLILDRTSLKSKEWQLDVITRKLRRSTERQGAQFISFDPENGEWKFLVQHFSRFGFSEDDEENIMMDDATVVQDPAQMDAAAVVQDPAQMGDAEIYDVDKETPTTSNEIQLSYSLPAHLRLDPVKMRGMRLLMFPDEEEAEDLSQKSSFGKEYVKSLQNSSHAMIDKSSPPVA